MDNFHYPTERDGPVHDRQCESFLLLLLSVLGGLSQQLRVLLLQFHQFFSLVLILILVLVLFAGEQFLLQLQVGRLDDQSLLQQFQLCAFELLL